MKKTELKALLKIIAEEVAAAKKSRIDETKGLSGFKESSDKVEHTEKVADSKSLTSTSEPKEKEEGKKLPKVKKPSNPSVGLKEEIMAMIRESIEEMSRTAGSIGSKYKVEDPNSPTGWVVKGHKTIPDGTPTEAPSGPYVKKGKNPNLGRPKSGAGSGEPVSANTKLNVKFENEDMGVVDMNRVKGSFMAYLKSFLSGSRIELGLYKIDPSVQAKLDELSDLYMDDKLPENATLDLQVDGDTVKAV